MEIIQSIPRSEWYFLWIKAALVFLGSSKVCWSKKKIDSIRVNFNFLGAYLWVYFRVKANLFDIFFASVCTPIENANALSSSPYKTNSKVKSFQVTENNILLIVNSWDAIKAHNWDNILIKIIQILMLWTSGSSLTTRDLYFIILV